MSIIIFSQLTPKERETVVAIRNGTELPDDGIWTANLAGARLVDVNGNLTEAGAMLADQINR